MSDKPIQKPEAEGTTPPNGPKNPPGTPQDPVRK